MAYNPFLFFSTLFRFSVYLVQGLIYQGCAGTIKHGFHKMVRPSVCAITAGLMLICMEQRTNFTGDFSLDQALQDPLWALENASFAYGSL